MHGRQYQVVYEQLVLSHLRVVFVGLGAPLLIHQEYSALTMVYT